MFNFANYLLNPSFQGTASVLTQNTLLDLIGMTNISGQDWISSANSAFSHKDQTRYDTVLFNSLDLISNNKNLERIKNYEFEFNMTSEQFFRKWLNGKVDISPKAHDWAVTYKNINDKWQKEKLK